MLKLVKIKPVTLGVTGPAYIREISISRNEKNRLTDEERILCGQLIGMANNINQVAKACHKEGDGIYFVIKGKRQRK